MRKTKLTFLFVLLLVFAATLPDIWKHNGAPKPVQAQTPTPYCRERNTSNTFYAGIGTPKLFTVGFFVLPQGYDFVRGYIYDGSAWQQPTGVTIDPSPSYQGTRYVGMNLTKTYTRDEDLCISSYVVYKKPDGGYGGLQCSNGYMRVYYLETGTDRGYGVERINKGQSKQITVTGSYPYIGAITSNYSPAKWTGDNKDSLPIPNPSNGVKGWILSGGGFINNAGSWTSGVWSDFLKASYFARYSPTNPQNLDSSYTLSLDSATFNSGEGADAYADYDLGDLQIYSRNNPGNTCRFPELPRDYCPLPVSQDGGVAKASLADAWQSVQFVSPATGYVEKVSVEVGNYGGAARKVTCQVVDSDGRAVSAAKKSKFFRGTEAGWRDISFKNKKFLLEAGRTYYLRCKGPDSWNSLYWVWDAAKGIDESKNFKVYFSCL